jgi:hypothetical protein
MATVLDDDGVVAPIDEQHHKVLEMNLEFSKQDEPFSGGCRLLIARHGGAQITKKHQLKICAKLAASCHLYVTFSNHYDF